MPVSVFAQNAVTMIGLGVGVDYALFLVSRCRDELNAGKSFHDAVEIATLRTVHVVVVSGLAVCTGFLALLLVRIPFLHTLALGGVTVVVTAMLMTLMVLPALLMVVGERVNWPRRFPQRSTDGAALWGRWARETMRKPWRYLVPSLVVLAVLIVPTLRLKAWNVGAHDLPPATEARQGYDLLVRELRARLDGADRTVRREPSWDDRDAGAAGCTARDVRDVGRGPARSDRAGVAGAGRSRRVVDARFAFGARVRRSNGLRSRVAYYHLDERARRRTSVSGWAASMPRSSTSMKSSSAA